MANCKYLRIRGEKHGRILIIQLKFLGYKISNNIHDDDFIKHSEEFLNKMDEFKYVLIDDDAKNIIFFVKKHGAIENIFPWDYPSYRETTIKELTEG